MRIIIETKRTIEMRYDTLGDWYYRECQREAEAPDGLEMVIEVDREQVVDPRVQLVIALHELIEAKLCEDAGITQEQVDNFDRNEWPKLVAKMGDWDWVADLEPGDAEEAPYRKQHRFAMLIEHLVARELGLEGYGVVR